MYHTDPPAQPWPDDPFQDNGGSDKSTGSTQTGHRQLALVKRGHRYIFDYAPGQETQLLERLAAMARDPNCSLGMFDVAVLSHQVGRGLSQQVQQILHS